MSEKRNTLSHLFEEYYGRLYTLAFRLSGNKEDAEDILQTAFYNASRGIEHFRQESSYYTWIYKIVVNCAKKFMNKKAKLPVEYYSEVHHVPISEIYQYINSYGATDNEVLIKMVRETCLQMFMNCLPDKYRSIYTLRIILGLSEKDASEILSISESSAKVRLHRAKQKIKDHLSGYCSLVKKDAPCDCRKFAAYAEKKQLQHKIFNHVKICRIENEAYERFHKEIDEITKINLLYKKEISPIDDTVFKDRIRKLILDKDFILLN